jgi:hypothetical protein
MVAVAVTVVAHLTSGTTMVTVGIAAADDDTTAAGVVVVVDMGGIVVVTVCG